jgi:hypothetical protein
MIKISTHCTDFDENSIAGKVEGYNFMTINLNSVKELVVALQLCKDQLNARGKIVGANLFRPALEVQVTCSRPRYSGAGAGIHP